MTPIDNAFAEYNRHINCITTFAQLTVYDHFTAGYEAAQRDKQSLPPVERIKADAEEVANSLPVKTDGDVFYKVGYEEGYIAGATAEADRARVLAEEVQLMLDQFELSPELAWFEIAQNMKRIGRKALQQWKEGKEVGNE